MTTLAALGAGAGSPALTAAPAGRVVPVGGPAEGIVADPATGLVAVGVRHPDRIVLLDGRTGAIRGRVRLPGRLRHLDLATPGGTAVAADRNSGNLITVTLPGGAVLATVAVGRYPHPVTRTGDGTFAVAGGAFALVRDGRVIHREITRPGGVAAAGDRVGVIDVRDGTLAVYHPGRAGRLTAGDDPTHLIADHRGRLLVVDTGGDRLLTFETTPRLRRIGSTPLPGSPYGVAYDRARDRLWVTLTARNQVAGLDLSGGTPSLVATFAAVRQPDTAAVDPSTGRLFVAGRADGAVQLVDPYT